MTDDTVAADMEVVVFMLGQQRYAMPLAAVQEIQQIVAMNEVPDSTSGLVGLINLRGDVVPAIDVRRLLGMEHLPYGLRTPMVLCRVRGSLVAFIVDEVEDVATVPPDMMHEPDPIYDIADKLVGVSRIGGELVFVLDADRLLPEHATEADSPEGAEAAGKVAPRKPAGKKRAKKAPAKKASQ